jgi:hypothetical protein
MRVKQGTTVASIKSICDQLEAGLSSSLMDIKAPFRGMCNLDSTVSYFAIVRLQCALPASFH